MKPFRPNSQPDCRSFKAAAIGLALMPVLARCAVREATPDGITIVYNAMHPQVAVYEAQQHCGDYGKTAVLVETMPARLPLRRCSPDRAGASSGAFLRPVRPRHRERGGAIRSQKRRSGEAFRQCCPV